MEKIVVHRAGGYERLRLERHPDPSPGLGEVVVDVKAIGVNYADCLVRMGLYSSAREYVGWPITPGFESAGNVAAVGTGVEDLRIGDRVVAVTRFGGYASRVTAPRSQVFRLPDAIGFEAGAAFPTIYLTAYYALVELANVRRSRTLLVHSAAGGVGSALVQLGKVLGCRVVGVVGSAHKVDAVRALGADAVIDKSREDLWGAAERHAPSGYDVVLDANGAETLRGSYRHLAPGGRLVIYGFHTMLPKGRGRPRFEKLAFDFLRTPRFDPLAMTQTNRSVLAFNLSYMFDRQELLDESMKTLLRWLDEGSIRVPTITRYPLSETQRAHRALESGSTVGKLLLIP